MVLKKNVMLLPVTDQPIFDVHDPQNQHLYMYGKVICNKLLHTEVSRSSLFCQAEVGGKIATFSFHNFFRPSKKYESKEMVTIFPTDLCLGTTS